MKRILFICAILVGAFASVPAAFAQSFPSQICIAAGRYADQCMNNKGGVIGDGNPQIYWNIGTPNNNYDISVVGTVCDGNQDCGGFLGPFVNGSLLNTRYKNDQVLTFNWQGSGAHPVGECVSSFQFSNNPTLRSAQAQTFGCNGAPNQLFVKNSSNGALFLVSVGGSNAAFVAHQPIPAWMGTAVGVAPNGSPFQITNEQSDNAGYYFASKA